jgi:alginate O-acetyltransferase complex protein AlgF
MPMKKSKQPHRFLAAALAVVLVGAALLAANAARAGDEALYGPAAPPGSAFVRIFNGTSQSLIDARVGPEDMNEVAPFEASEFTFLPPGSYDLTAGPVKQKITLAPDRFYTAAIIDGKVQLVDNDRFRNRMKALVVLYNLTGDAPLSLKTADGKTPVVENVPPSKSGQREVNAVRTQLALYKGAERVAAVRQVPFERGRAFSLFVAGTPQAPVPVWVVN